MAYLSSTITIILAMSFSIKTILKLICLLGLFACTSKPASAQDMVVEIDDITNRSGNRSSNNQQRKISQEVGLHVYARPGISLHYDGNNYRLSITGMISNDINSINIISPTGQQYPLQSLSVGGNTYQLSSLQSGYYTIVVQSIFGTFTQNFHLQH